MRRHESRFIVKHDHNPKACKTLLTCAQARRLAIALQTREAAQRLSATMLKPAKPAAFETIKACMVFSFAIDY